jgi:multimeric flavodoxin WrbA
MKILTICGSPRRGNSETIALTLQKLFKDKKVDNDIILLREKNIERCHGCVEFCNHELKCRLDDDMSGIMEQMTKADGFVFITPNYFQMPPGLFKDYIDRCSIFFTANQHESFQTKKAVVICVGSDEPEKTDVCTNIIAHNFCEIIGLTIVGTKSFQTHSELNGNYNDIFENSINLTVKSDLQTLADSLV